MQRYCYKEISNVDILVSIIGSRYGSAANVPEHEHEYSVSQQELRTALQENKQVFVFIDKNVYTEYETYLLNKGNTDVKYKYVDNPNIYKFIEEIKALPNNNNVKGFETADDIIMYLREQFAGLFKQFMIDNQRIKEALIIRDIENTAKTLQELVDYLKEENRDKEDTINQIVRVNHPLVRHLKAYLRINYNFYIEGVRDLAYLLEARNFKWNADLQVWVHQGKTREWQLKISDDLFDDNGKLKYMKAEDWKEDFCVLTQFPLNENTLPF